MEKKLSANETCRLVGEELGIERSCIRPCFDESDSRVCCLVHESWLQRYIAGVLSQEEPELVSPWSTYEHQLILQPSHPEPVAPWIRISIQIIKKPIRKAPLRKSFPDAFQRGVDDGGKCTVLSFTELMQCVGVHNLRHNWESALESYPWAAHCVLPAPMEKTSDKNILDEMLLHAYGLSARHLFSDPESSEHGIFGSSAERVAFDDFKEESEGSSLSLIMKNNVVPFVCALEGQSAYFLIEPYYQHSLHNMVTFSPYVLSGSHIRPLFMIYELLHALYWYHSRGIAHGALTLHKIKVSKGLWIYLESPDFYHTCSLEPSSSEAEAVSCDKAATKPQLGLNESLASKYTTDDLPNLVELWVHGKISNFDYLMALNFLVGRRLGDPNYHPVFPWVTDFSVRDGGYRDLKKSKFRLNKGDRQLDVTYKAALFDSQEGAPPHHVSDVLSDITYHVYLARRTPKSVLCDHVRSNWVANEYPSSMERLYHWTPDECIPQFFSDATIFESVHEDLPDLELPPWTTSAEEFIQWHRSVLESDAVSASLQHWIDLTFGYKLAGKAAVKAKNVYLHLIDKHQSLSNHGVVQLFTEPHPKRAQPCLPHSNTLFLGRGDHEMVDGKLIRSLVRFNSEQMAEKSSALEDSVMSIESVSENDFLLGHQPKEKHTGEDLNNKAVAVTGKEAIEEEVSKGAQFQAIIIPTNYNPLEMLETFQALEKFKNQFGPRSVAGGSNEQRQPEEKTNFGKLVQADMISLGCAIVEMLMPGKVQLSTCGLTGKQREKAIVKLCETNSKLLPRYARAAVHALFKDVFSSAEGDTVSHDGWMPPLTADLLLQPHLDLFPFPSYFAALHEFLAAFYHSGRKANGNTHKSKPQDSLTFLRNEAGYTVEQVDIAASFLPTLLPIVDDEGLKLLLYHLDPLFACLETRLHACTQLFDMLAQALGPKNTVKTFLKCLLSLFDSHDLEMYEVVTKQTFLSQIIVRFGLDGFLKHFISFVVDAVAFTSKVESKAGKGDRLSMLSGEGVTSEIPVPEMEYNAKDVALDMDDLDLPGSFLSEGSEDRDVQIGLMNIEDLDTEGEFAATRQNRDQVGGDEDKDDEIVEQVTLLPRGIIDEEGYGRLFQGHISVDDDDDVPVTDEMDDGRRLRNVAGIGNIRDVVTRQQGVDDEALEAEDGCTSTSAGAGSGDFDNIEYIDVDDQELHSENDPTSGSNQEKQRLVESETNDGSILATHVLQSENEDLDVKNGDVELQEIDASSTKRKDSSESFTEKTGHDIGVNKMLARNVISQGKSIDEEEENGEVNEEDVHDENPDELTEDDDAKTEEAEGSGEDGLEQIRLPVEGNLAFEEDREDSSGDDDSHSNAILDPEDEQVTKDQPSAHQIKTFYNSTKPKNIQQENKAQKHDELTPGTISGIAAESIVWLAPRLGPVLTSRYIVSQLLTMLPHCYMGYVGSNDDDDDAKTVHDRNAKWLLFCLSNFCTLYGEAFMLNQYLPYINKTIRGVQTKVTQRGEAALAGVLSLLKYCIPYLSRDTLSSYIESDLMTGVFQPVIRILSSYNLTFPGGVTARQAICRSYIDVLTVVCSKLERELARENMTAPVKQFFSCFELERMRTITMNELKSSPVEHEQGFGTVEEFEGAAEGRDEKDTSSVEENGSVNETQEDLYNTPVYEELCQTFSAAIAHHAFVPLCGLMGSKYMESSLLNHDLIWNLCCSHDVQLSHPTCEDTRASEDEEDGEENGIEGSEVDSAPAVGSRGLDNAADERIQEKKGGKEGRKFRKRPKPPMWFIGRKLSKAKDVPTNLPSSSDQYLRGSWLTHWENQLSVKGKVGNKFSLQQVKLQTFTGHSAPVRSVYVQDSEHCFLSASKDKTVKLWSLSNHGDGTAQSASSWTYYRHTRPVFHVGMVESVRHAVSCDGSLHLWDPVSGRCLRVFDQQRNNPVVAMATLPAPSQCVVAAMAEGTARLLDVRQHSFVTEWKVTTSSVPGTVRDVCCSPDGRWIAFGFSTGLASVLDFRGGLLRSQRRAHIGDIFQVKAFSSTSFLTSSVDSGLSLWKDDGLRLKSVKGPSDPLPSLLVWGDQVISASISGKIGVHNLQEDLSEDHYVSYKLSSDVFRGSITCLGYLPLNRLLLIGSDTGNIVLCS